MSNSDRSWLTTWAQAHTDMAFFSGGVKDNTVRLSIQNRIPGSAVRVHFSNQVGKKPAQIVRATLIVGNREVIPLRFVGKDSVQLLPGEAVYSDPAQIQVEDGETLSVSIAVAGKVNSGNNMNEMVRYSSKGDHSMERIMPELKTMDKEIAKASKRRHGPFMPLLSRIEILSGSNKKIILCFGDSITQQCQWTKPVSQQCVQSHPDVVIVNMGIDGDKLLTDPMMKFLSMYGEAGIKRFDRDILEVPGASAVIFALGTNDIGMARDKAALEESGSRAIMRGLLDLNARAKAAGMKTYLATLTPRGGSAGYKKMHEDERLLLNKAIRECKAFDGILDFEAAVRDEKDPFRMKAEYDSGDHLHPGKKGGEAIAEVVMKKVVNEL